MDTLSPSSQNPDTPVSPAGQALAVLLVIEDNLDADVLLMERGDTIVVLVGSIDAWEAFTLALIARHYAVEERIGDHMQATQALVEQHPVMVLHGDLDEAAAPAEQAWGWAA